MLGKDLFRVDANNDFSLETYKSLIFFYAPLISNDALYIYQFLALKGSSLVFEEINNLLNSLNISIDIFEDKLKILNQYKLIRTLKKDDENKYIFIINNPLNIKSFIKNDIYVRNFIQKTSGLYYQTLISDLSYENYQNFKDISAKFEANILQNWTKDDESYLKSKNNEKYDFDTYFDINKFINDMSLTLLPMRYRNKENLQNIAMLADLYNIDFERMRKFIPVVCKSDGDNFDLNYLKYLCQQAVCEYKKVENNTYQVPCQLFLLNLQDGKELSPYDKKILYTLANKYRLSYSAINVLLEHCLKTCDNHLFENYLYPIASDMHRNNVQNYLDAQKFLTSYNKISNKKSDYIEEYNPNNNPIFDEESKKALENMRKND